MTKDELRLLYTLDEAADILAVKPSCLEGLLRNDETPRHLIGGKLRFTLADLEAIVAMCERVEACAKFFPGAL